MKLCRLMTGVLVILLACCVSFAQSDLGTLSGFVKDPSGAFVPGAKIIVKNENTGVERQATTNESGYWVMTSVQAGMYAVSVELQGFKKFESGHNKLDPSASLSVAPKSFSS